MKSFYSCLFIFFYCLISCSPRKEETSALKLFYKQPAREWTEALPIGNGRIGGMIFGGIQKERVQFNEETLWTGAPRNHNRKGAYRHLETIRNLLFEGEQDKAEALAEKAFMGKKSHEDEYDSLQKLWLKKVRDPRETEAYISDDVKNNWKSMEIPVSDGWEKAGLEAVDGALWFRTTVDVPENWLGRQVALELGRIRDWDYTYVNGKLVGSVRNDRKERKYTIPSGYLKDGENVILIQVINFNNKGGLTGVKGGDVMRMYPKNAPGEAISLQKTWQYKIQDNTPPSFPAYQASYQPFGDLWIDFPGLDTISNYRRELDISTAVARTSFEAEGVKYTREYLASHPDKGIVLHMAANKASQINFRASLSSLHSRSSISKIDDHTIALNVKVKNGVLQGMAYLHVMNNNGTVVVNDSTISVENADEATLFLTAATNYKNYKDVTGDPDKLCREMVQQVKNKSYKALKSTHTSDYQQYFNTFSIDLGKTRNEELPTDERIKRFYSEDDPSLLSLYTQYGRYLMISTSRPGTRPPNLQGIWNDLLTPPWGSKYTCNINLEMNYWPAEVLNLSEFHAPLFDMIDELAENGKETAKEHYDCPGWVLHHNTDLWRGTAPINASNHGIWVTGGAWLCHHLWEHYLFTQDTAFLRNRAYPAMKSAATFFVNFLIPDPETGWLISTPSNSPENGGLVAGPAMDHQIIRDLFANCIMASEILDVDYAFADTLQEMYKKIAPNQVGKHGQLQEWLKDIDDPDNHHRHVSHLWGVHPGNDFNWETAPDLMNAAKQSLIFRGDEGTGWSLGWKINLWARFKEGDHAFELIKILLSPAEDLNRDIRGGSYPNLFDAHPPFQIDGNFGAAAGVAEMLVQSHAGYIDLLPALPAALPLGEVKGLRARGGFTLNITWDEGKLETLEVTSKAGNICTIKYGEKEKTFETHAGKTYQLDRSLELMQEM